LQVKFTAIQIGGFTEDELHQHIQEFVEAEKEKANKGLGALMGGNQMETIQQLQGIMEDKEVKAMITKVSTDKKGAVNAISEIAQNQIKKVVEEENLFIKFTTMLKLQITVVELRRLFYWVSALEMVLMLLGAVFFTAFILHDQTQVLLYWALSTHWIRAVTGFLVMKTFARFEEWFLAAINEGMTEGEAMGTVLEKFDGKSGRLLCYVGITVFSMIADLIVLGFLIKIYGEDDSSSALLADLYLLVMTIAMLSMDVFLLIWMPSAYMRLPPDLQKHVALKISSRCPCLKCCLLDEDAVEMEDVEEGRSNRSGSLANQDAEVNIDISSTPEESTAPPQAAKADTAASGSSNTE